MKKILLSTLFFGCGSFAFAGGFQLNLQGLRQLAMGGGGAAHAWDISTLFYNPAGLSQLQGIQAYAAIVGVSPTIKFVQTPTGGYSYNTKSQLFTPFNVYIGGPIKKDSKIGVGVGVYTPYGSGTKWPDNWEGRYLNQEIELQSIYVQPTVSYKINDMISLGAGFIYAFGNVKLRQALPVQYLDGSDGEASLKGNGNGLGYNLGLHVKATNNLEVGLTYRSKVNMKVSSGNAVFTVPASLSSSFPNGDFSASLPLPSVLSLGLAYKVTSKLMIQADVNYVSWKAYDTLSFDYANNTPQLQDTHTPRLYQNKAAFRLGAHYQITKSVEGMIGGAYDPSPVKDGYVSPELPDANRLTGSIGIAVQPISKVSIMAVVEYVSSAKRDGTFIPGNFSGKYQSKALNIGLGLTYNF